jgi:hypothetical protein
MATVAEVVCDLRMHGQKTLRVAYRLESSHSAFAFPRRLVGVFGAVFEPTAFPVLYSRYHLAPGGHIALQFIGDDRTWYILQALQQLSEEALRGFGVAPLLYQDIEHLAILVDGAPKVLQLAVDPEEDFIEMPPIAETSAAGTNPLGVQLATLRLCMFQKTGTVNLRGYKNATELPVTAMPRTTDKSLFVMLV